MRQVQALVLALCGGAMLGCIAPQAERTTAKYPTRMACEGPTGPNSVQLRVALIERPVGDLALNQDIWELVDEQGLDLEHKAQLHDNGFRMGQFGNVPPPSLDELIHSERSCANPRQIRMLSGNTTTVVLGTTQGHCTFNLVHNGQTTPVELDEALCQFQVVPTILSDGGTRLQITPVIKHGQTVMQHHAVKDPAGTLRWELLAQQPLETYPDLSWEQTITDSEYLVIGAWIDRPNTLGQRCFIQAENDPPIQRLLVLRALRGGLDPIMSDELLSKSPSLAAQAGLTTARGMRP